MDQWLIRTKDNWIVGPYSRAQVSQLILDGKLTVQDEVCAANQYWFCIHERGELAQQLGIDVSVVLRGVDENAEVTETQLENDEKTDTELMNLEASHSPPLPEPSSEGTSVLDVGVLKKRSKKKQKHTELSLSPMAASPVKFSTSSTPEQVPLFATVHAKKNPFYRMGLFWGLCVSLGVFLCLFFYLFKV